jgi:hypothetical protein
LTSPFDGLVVDKVEMLLSLLRMESPSAAKIGGPAKLKTRAIPRMYASKKLSRLAI